MMSAMTTIMATIVIMPIDKAIFLKEFRNGYYSVSAYYVATLLCNLMFQCIYGILLCSISYFVIGLYPSAHAFGTYVGLFMVTFNLFI